MTDTVNVPREWWSDAITARLLTDEQLNAAWCAPGGDGEFASTWDDKPHRLVYILLGHIKAMLEAAPKAEPVSDLPPISLDGPHLHRRGHDRSRQLRGQRHYRNRRRAV